MSTFKGIRSCTDGVEIDLKVVPGARGDSISGRLGDRIKIRVSAPPEDGKANKAIIRLMADQLGARPGAVTISSGTSSTEKTVRVEGIGTADAYRLLLDRA